MLPVLRLLMIDNNRQTNSLTEIIFDEALKDARALDEYFRHTKQLIGPLHGIPVMLKDQFDVKGFDTTLGYTGRAFKSASRNAVLVDILKSLGAVILAKTNLPQSIMVSLYLRALWQGLTSRSGVKPKIHSLDLLSILAIQS